MEKEVLRYVKDAEYNPNEYKIGFEIPFSRYFYEHHRSRKLEDVESDILKVEYEIRLLTEKRQVTINQAVTSGLNPKAHMKKTTIRWIGDIPEHWKLNRIKFTSYVKGRIGWQGLHP